MTISQFDSESEQSVIDNGSSISSSSSATSSSIGGQPNRRNPPARNTSRFWFERFLAVIQRQNPSVIDASFLSQIAPSNEGKLLAQLKFLRVIDEQGKPTLVLPMLNMVGEEQKRAFQEIAKDSYRDLFVEVKIDKAVPDDLVNYFIRKYSFTRDKAINAAKFFLYLAEKGSIVVSPELGSFLSEKAPSASSGQNGTSSSGTSSALRTSSERPQTARIIGLVRPSLVSSISSLSTNGTKFGTQRKRMNGRDLQQQQEEELLRPRVQATISISLDKDTPKEYWDRVLALLGERSTDYEAKLADVANSEKADSPEAKLTENEEKVPETTQSE